MNKLLYKITVCCASLCAIENNLAALESPPIAMQDAAPTVNCLDDLDTIVKNALELFNVPGIAVGIVADGKIVLTKGYGYRNVEKGLPVTENTLFAIGSCTKAFTTFMLGQLVDEGKIAWDDPVINHIPEFRLMDQYAAHHLTIRDLAAHRTGLGRHDMLWFNPAITRSDILKALPHLEPACNLREKFQYNNLMYGVAGILIEKVTGKTWEEALSSRIFTPLNMPDSTGTIEDSLLSQDYSLPYSEVTGEIQTIPFRPIPSVASAGAINSSASDMMQWVQLQLSQGKLLDKQFIRKETLEEMHTIQMPMAMSAPDEEVYNFGYGLGWCTGFYRGHYYLHHGGGIDGFISQVSLLPHKKIGVVVLSNSSSDGSWAVSCIANTIIDRLLGENDVDWIEKLKTFREQFKKVEQESQVEGNLSASIPSQKLEEYIGYYEHPAYGLVEVKLEDDKFCANYGEIILPLSHKCHDIFNGKINESIFGGKSSISFSFSRNTSGDIAELHIPFESTVKPIVFKRKADSGLFSTDYLKQFEGVYGEGPLTVEVSLSQNKLTAATPGMGPEMELTPDKPLKFSVKGSPGHYIQFVLDNEGKVSEFLYIHTLGSLSFKSNR